MKAFELPIHGAWLFEPQVFPDDRGMFSAPFQAGVFREALGYSLEARQTNSSRSHRGVVRGVHFADTPPGQSKYLYCPNGSVCDIIVDLRVGSPTFGQSESVVLDGTSMRAVFLSEGLGHAFMALEDNTVTSYLCSMPYNPGAERGVTPLDADLDLPWPKDEGVILSQKDAAAPTLAQAQRDHLLPDWERCLDWYASCRD